MFRHLRIVDAIVGYLIGYDCPLVNCYITMENHHAINGEIHYFYGHFQVSKLLVYQRLCRSMFG